MRITKIAVKGLFGMFDHEIPLNQESRITIVHGPNGVGKTVLMRMAHGLFNFDYEYIGSKQFDTFDVEFDDLRGIRVVNIAAFSRLMIGLLKEPSFPFLRLAKRLVDDTVFALRTSDLDEEIQELAKTVLGGEYMHIQAGSNSYWLQWFKDGQDLYPGPPEETPLMRDHLLSICDLLEKHPEMHNEVYGEMREWFANLRRVVKLRQIDTHRLLSDEVDIDELKYIIFYDDGEVLEAPTGGLAAAELASKIAAKLGDIDLDLERDVISRMDASPELIQMINDAIIESAAESNPESPKFQKIEREYPGTWKAFLNTLLDVYRVKGLLSERELFKEILNERLLYKSLEIDGDEGIKIVDENGDDLHPSYLSSGEQHILILYSQLLFEIEPNSLVMIDEPEISMNVVWQRNFLKDLQRIVELRNFDILIATHSPMIIHDKWDWVVHLGAKADD